MYELAGHVSAPIVGLAIEVVIVVEVVNVDVVVVAVKVTKEVTVEAAVT